MLYHALRGTCLITKISIHLPKLLYWYTLSTKFFQTTLLEKKVDAETHTGQQWSEDDIRSARFLHRAKQVNPQWSMDLAAKIPIIEVNTKVVACDGGGGALGHPR